MEPCLVILLFVSIICKLAELISVSLAIDNCADPDKSFLDYYEIISVRRVLTSELVLVVSLIVWFFTEICCNVERHGKNGKILRAILSLLKLLLSIVAVANSSAVIRGFCITAVIASAAHFMSANCCCCCYDIKK